MTQPCSLGSTALGGCQSFPAENVDCAVFALDFFEVFVRAQNREVLSRCGRSNTQIHAELGQRRRADAIFASIHNPPPRSEVVGCQIGDFDLFDLAATVVNGDAFPTHEVFEVPPVEADGQIEKSKRHRLAIGLLDLGWVLRDRFCVFAEDMFELALLDADHFQVIIHVFL